MGKAQAYSSKPRMLNFWLLRSAALSLLGMSLGYAVLLHVTATSAVSQTNATGTETGTVTEVLMRPTLKPGSRGTDVTELQATLKLLGYYGGTVDGVYGQSTVTAVSQFQQAAGLNADGITGPATWNRLFPAAETPSTAPTSTASGTVPTPAATSPAATSPAATSPAATSAASPPVANTAASFPVPAGASRTLSSSKPATNARPTVKPTPSTATPKPSKPATTSTPAPTSTNASVALPVLRQGMKGSAVVALQERLRSLGVLKGAADGVFGAETVTAVKAAQRSFKLEPDGVVGAGTWSALLR